jgi:2-dehydropantoate 2-reductase
MLCGRTPRDHVEVRCANRTPILVPGPVRTDPGAVEGPVDVVLLAVKDTHNAAAARWLARLCGEATVVCALQNGVEQVARLDTLCQPATVLPAVVWMSAELQPEGWVRLRTDARLVLPDTAAARPLAALLTVQGLTTELATDFTTASWRKLMVNALAGFTVLAGRRAGMFRRDDIGALARRYLIECVAVGRAHGAKLADDEPDEVIAIFTDVPEDLTTSMLTDRQEGRPLEWDICNGVVSRLGQRHGIETPVSDVLVPLLAAASEGPG